MLKPCTLGREDPAGVGTQIRGEEVAGGGGGGGGGEWRSPRKEKVKNEWRRRRQKRG